jgi:predicted ATP-dependent serine protease
MTQETKPEQTPARAEKPAPAGKAEQPKNHVGNEAAVIELTNADLQAVNGGGGVSGGVLRNGGRGGIGGDV